METPVEQPMDPVQRVHQEREVQQMRIKGDLSEEHSGDVGENQSWFATHPPIRERVDRLLAVK